MKIGSLFPLAALALLISLVAVIPGCGPGSLVRFGVKDKNGGGPAGLPLSLIVPTNLTGTPESSGSIFLSWTDEADGELGFEIERSLDQENFVRVGTADGNTTSYRDQVTDSNDLRQNTTYYYRIRTIGANNAAGEFSEYSNLAFARTMLNEPLEFTASAITSKLIYLTWDTNETAGDKFQIDRSMDNTVFESIAEIPVQTATPSASYEDKDGLSEDTTYYYRIRAISTDNGNESLFTHLDNDNYPTTPGLNARFFVPDDFSTIQKAINQAGSGDLIMVRPGTYLENIDFSGKNITLKSCGGPAVTVIDGQKLDSVVKFQSGETAFARLEGFTIINGKASEGAGIVCIAASPVIVGNRVENNRADTEGGGIYISTAAPSITGNIIRENIVSGFISQGGGLSLNTSAAVITRNRIEDNRVSGGLYSQGGGIYCNATSAPLIQENIIRGNDATDGFSSCFGGGIECHGAQATILNNYISHNRALGTYGQGGGIFCLGFSPIRIAGNLIAHNSAAMYGGGIFCSEASPDLFNNTIVYNNGGQLGGGLGCIFAASKPEVRNTILWGNQAVDGLQIGLKEFFGQT
ncbi:MAG: hypothetical protein KJ645_05310, partial [Planctomycetes bacterium]|nr:hypothetical protein [Planctomycetota bacterium]